MLSDKGERSEVGRNGSEIAVDGASEMVIRVSPRGFKVVEGAVSIRYMLVGGRERVSASVSILHFKEILSIGGYSALSIFLFILVVLYTLDCRKSFSTAELIARHEIE